MYLDSKRFNDINWEAFHKDSVIYLTAFDYPFYDNPGVGIQYFTNHCSNVKSFSDDFKYIYDANYKIWRFDLNQAVETVLQDEGFVTPSSHLSKETSELCNDSCNSDISSLSTDEFQYDPQSQELNRFTWEHLGQCAPPTEPPFASENPRSVIYLWKIWNAFRHPMMKSLPVGEQICFEDLKIDINYLLFGMTSYSFYLNQVTGMFHLRDALHLPTVTSEMLLDFCKPFIECGYYYYTLKNFTERRLKIPFGPVHRIFWHCLREVLCMYRYCVLQINWNDIRCFTQLEIVVLPLKEKLTFLSKLCFISMSDTSSGMKFPASVQLLDYLYSNLSKISRSDFRYMFFHLFEGCCNAYLKIIAEWIFNGCFSNPENYEEFFIEIQREHEICRDWRRVSCIRVKEKRVPKCLEKIYKDIFVCGKSVNLLKIFSPRDVLETVLPQFHPVVHCCFNETQIDQYTKSWKQFEEDCFKNFKRSIRLKDKLVKKYNAEFYGRIKAVREEWFKQYERNQNRKKLDFNITTDIIERNKLFSSEHRNSGTKILSVSHDTNAVSVVENTVLIEDGNGRVNTKNCLLHSSALPPLGNTADCEEIHSDSCSCSSVSAEFGDQKNSDPVYKVNESGDCPAGDASNNPVHNENMDNYFSAVDLKLRTRLTVTLPTLVHDGSGDAAFATDRTPLLSESDQNKFKSESSDYQNYLNVVSNQEIHLKMPSTLLNASNSEQNAAASVNTNGQNILNTTADEIINNKLRASTPLSACAQNRFKNMSSVICEGSSPAKYDEKEETVYSTPITVSMRNKLKVMSSTIQENLSPANDAKQEKITDSMPITECLRNKQRVMLSEYHQRLCNSVDETFHPEVVKHCELNDYEKNKLKVMSSEYHIRLGAIADQNKLIEEKLALKTAARLIDQESNEQKILASEYQNLLKTSSVDKTYVENSKQEDATSESKNENEFTVIDAESESVSEIDEPVTVVENLKECSSICEPKKTTYEESRALNEKNILDLENYVSHPDVLKIPIVQNIDQLKSIADSVKDIDTTSIMYFFLSSVLVPLRIQSKLVNDAILRVFIEQERYLDHLIILKNYILLRKPEFSLLLTNTIFEMSEKVKKPLMLLNSYTLSSILQQSLLVSNSRKSIHFERKLSLVIEDTIPEAFILSDIRMLNCLSLTYSVKWPINVLITESIMKKYSRVFEFLMQLQRASWTLKSDFKSLKNLKRGKSIQYTQIQLYRHSMTQVIRVLLEFIMREALEKCWNDLIEYLLNTEVSLDELYMSHLRYINKIMQRCLLCDLSISCHDAVLNLLTSILKYHDALRAGSWQLNEQVNFLYHTNFKNIHAVFGDFQKHLDSVRTELKLLIYRQQRRYLEPLLIELCNNSRNEVHV